MRYDRNFRGYNRGWTGERMAGMPRYDELFRGGRGYDGGYRPFRGVDHLAHPSANQHVESGETDFLGRPYPRAAGEDVPWGLIDQERMQARFLGYDAGYQPPGGGYAARRDPRGWSRGYDRGYQGGARGYDRVAGMRYGGSYGGGWGYDHDMRPEDFHARNLPDSDEAGVDLHRMYGGRNLRYTSDWTRWF